MRDDFILLAALQRQDKHALVEVFDKYSTSIFRYAYRLCGNQVEADDVVGEVFMELLDRVRKKQGPRDNLRAYLYQIAYHKIVDKSRREKRVADLDDEFRSSTDDNPLARNEKNALYGILLDAMHKHLTHDQQHVIALRFFEGLSVHETSVILAKDTNNVKVIQSRGIAKLREVLDVELMKEML